jgi:hypothetical protein
VFVPGEPFTTSITLALLKFAARDIKDAPRTNTLAYLSVLTVTKNIDVKITLLFLLTVIPDK